MKTYKTALIRNINVRKHKKSVRFFKTYGNIYTFLYTFLRFLTFSCTFLRLSSYRQIEENL